MDLSEDSDDALGYEAAKEADESLSEGNSSKCDRQNIDSDRLIDSLGPPDFLHDELVAKKDYKIAGEADSAPREGTQNSITDRFIDSLDQEVVPDEVIEEFLLNCTEECKPSLVSTKRHASVRELNPNTSNEARRASRPGVVWVNGIDAPTAEDESITSENNIEQDITRTENDSDTNTQPETVLQRHSTNGSFHSSVVMGQGYLVEAEAVENGDGLQGSIIATAKPDPWWRRNQWWLALVLAIGVVLAFVLAVTEINKTDSPTTSPTTVEYGVEENIRSLIVSRFPKAEEALMDQSTPQFKASRWVIEKNLLNPESYQDERVLQQYSLAAFYFSTKFNEIENGQSADWVKNNGWLDSQHECTWDGVECGVQGSEFESKVTGLTLPSNGLSGSIPPDIAILSSSISKIVLDNNNINGSIPPEIGHLSLLSVLHLSQNKLTGVLPETVGTMRNLVSLNLSKNALSSTIPMELGMLSKLQSINIGKNKLVGSIPSQIGKLSALEKLDFGSNELSYALPKEIGFLSTLKKLFLQDNKLLGPLPPEMGSLSSLQVVDMSRNYIFDQIPVQLWQMGGLPNLEHLDLSHNLLTGTLSDDFGKSWQRLKILRLGGKNFLKGTIPSTIYRFEFLEELDLSFNFLTGTVPRSISTLDKLYSLNLSGNELRGIFPETLYLLSELKLLELSRNNFSGGTLPSLIGNLSRLQSFGISGVSGTIPEELWSLTRLQSLKLIDTEITETLSSNLGALTELTSLTFRENKKLEGSMPTELRYLEDLIHLDFSYNQLKGTIPTEVGTLTKLEVFDVRSNKISGILPTELGNMIRLKDLNTGINRMSGYIPSELGLLSDLTSLRPGANLLQGSIPSEIGSLTHLKDLRLVLTALSGSIPSELRNLMKLEILYLYDSRLTGSIPNEICQMDPLPLLHVDCSEVVCYCCGCTQYMPSQEPSLSSRPTQTELPTRKQSYFPTSSPSFSEYPSANTSPVSENPISAFPTVADGRYCFAFTSISSYGSPLSAFDEDDRKVLELPFSFNFRLAETNYTAVTIDRKAGSIIMGTENLDDCLAGVMGGRLYQDGRPADSFVGDVYTHYHVDENFTALVISWEGDYFSTGYNVNFQTVLYPEGDIEIRWGAGVYPPTYSMISSVCNACLNHFVSPQWYPFTNVLGPVTTTDGGVWPSNQCALYLPDDEDGYEVIEGNTI